MAVSEAELEELRGVCPGATLMQDGAVQFVFLPSLALPAGAEPAVVNALLCPVERAGYKTRLYLSEPVKGRGQNWTGDRILDREWHTWSWQHVGGELRLVEMLAEHLRALR